MDKKRRRKAGQTLHLCRLITAIDRKNSSARREKSSRRLTKLRQMVTRSFDAILQSVCAKCQNDVNFKISGKISLKIDFYAETIFRNTKYEIEIIFFKRKCHVWFHLWMPSGNRFRVVAIHNPHVHVDAVLPGSKDPLPTVDFLTFVLSLRVQSWLCIKSGFLCSSTICHFPLKWCLNSNLRTFFLR